MATISSPSTYVQTLSQAGLSADQALIYEMLIKNGPLPAGKIHQKTPFKRGLVYKLLEQLEGLGVVTKKTEPGKVAIFEPAHPLKLKELAEKKEDEAKRAQTALQGVLDSMTSDFNMISGKPGVKVYEGLNGIQKVYDEILLRGRNIKILASNIDRNNSKLSELIDTQTQKQNRLGITTKAIGSENDTSLSDKQLQELKETGIELRYLANFELPGQIIIFKDIVAISALTPELVTTVIQNQAITDTMTFIFDTLWGITAQTKQPAYQSPAETSRPNS